MRNCLLNRACPAFFKCCRSGANRENPMAVGLRCKTALMGEIGGRERLFFSNFIRSSLSANESRNL